MKTGGRPAQSFVVKAATGPVREGSGLAGAGFAGDVFGDGAAGTGATPVQMLALSLAGCMAIDLVHILTRGRHPVASLSAEIRSERAVHDPKRFTRVYLDFTLTGGMLPEHVERAIDLSREKYCSIWATLRQDIELVVAYTITGR